MSLMFMGDFFTYGKTKFYEENVMKKLKGKQFSSKFVNWVMLFIILLSSLATPVSALAETLDSQ